MRSARSILSRFFTDRFAKLSDIVYEQDVDLARKRLGIGSVLSIISTGGYYGAYAYVIWRTLLGKWGIGTFYFLTAAILNASSNIQQVLSTLSGIADQALFLTDLLAFFEMKPTIQSKPNAIPPCGGAPNSNAFRMKPNLFSASSFDMPSVLNIRI